MEKRWNKNRKMFLNSLEIKKIRWNKKKDREEKAEDGKEKQKKKKKEKRKVFEEKKIVVIFLKFTMPIILQHPPPLYMSIKKEIA